MFWQRLMLGFQSCVSNTPALHNSILAQFNASMHTWLKNIRLFREGCRKSARDNPERYCGWFWIHCSSNKSERMTQGNMDVRLRLLKESNKSRFDNYSVRNSVLIYVSSVYYLSGLLFACTFFPTTFLEIAAYTVRTNTAFLHPRPTETIPW